MSRQLLLRAKQHIVDDGGLLASYTVKYYRWSDKDLNGSASIALFRMTGTGGPANHEAQQQDVSLFLLATPRLVTQADNNMLSVLQYLRANFSATSVYAFHPLQGYVRNGYSMRSRRPLIRRPPKW